MSSKRTPGDCRADPTKRGTQALTKLKADLGIFVFSFDNHCVPVDADPSRIKSKHIELISQDLKVYERASGNQQAGLRPNVPSWELPEQYGITGVSYK